MEEHIDFFALSFVREADDIDILRRTLSDLKCDAQIIAKIEDQSGLANLDEIIKIIRNADDRPGQISLQLDLKNSSTNATEPLTRLVLPSSTPRNIPLNRPAIDESLTFPIPHTHRDFTFDQIIVEIIPARERSLGGSHVAIQSFELLP